MATGQPYGNPETRSRILDAAWRLVQASSAEVTLGNVADEAGVSRQAVYLHFANRSGLLVALVEHMDRELALDELIRAVRDAATGREALEQMVAVHATYHEHIIGVARILDAARHHDPDVAAAWESRMARRRERHRHILQRLADDGELAPGWDVDSASLLLHSLTLPRVWDELVVEQGWSPTAYRDHVTRVLIQGLLARP